MEKIQWSIEEIGRLMRKQWIQNNIIMLLLFVLFCYLAVNGKLPFFIGTLGVLLWIQLAITFYTVMTGKLLVQGQVSFCMSFTEIISVVSVGSEKK